MCQILLVDNGGLELFVEEFGLGEKRFPLTLGMPFLQLGRGQHHAPVSFWFRSEMMMA